MSTSNNSIGYNSLGVNYCLRNTRKIQIQSHVTCAYYTMSYNTLRNDNEMRRVRKKVLEEKYA